MSLAERLRDAGYAPDGTKLHDDIDLRDESRGYTTVCPDQRRDFVDIQEALHYHALANGDGCWRDLLSHAATEISRLRALYDGRTAELMRVMAERDDLLAERGIVHHGSEAT